MLHSFCCTDAVLNLLGAPLRAHVLLEVIRQWNSSTWYDADGVKLGQVHGSQLGVSEYVITTEKHFQRMRNAFVKKGDFILDDLVQALASGNFVLRMFPRVKVTLRIPTLPHSVFEASHMLRLPIDLPGDGDLEQRMAAIRLQ